MVILFFLFFFIFQEKLKIYLFRHSPILSRPNTNTNNKPEPMNYNQYYAIPQYVPPQQPQQPQQHMNINHMLSPRAPASSALNHLNTHQYSGKPPSTPQQDSKLNRFMHMWQRNHTNKVEPNQHRLSMPQPQAPVFDRKALESSSSVWRDPIQAPVLNPPSTYDRQRTSNLRSQPEIPTSPKLSSWLPGLFHFKQPKVCSLECEARDEREAIGKVSQVLEEVSYPFFIIIT